MPSESSNEITLNTIKSERMLDDGAFGRTVRAANAFLADQGFGYGDRLIIEGGERPARQRLVEALAAPGRMVEVGGAVPDGRGLRLTLVRTVATPPTCGDWSDPPTHDFSNLPNGNFGCATQSNLARMVADPNDLAGGAAAGSFDSERMTVLIDAYRNDAITITEYNVTSQTGGGGGGE
jgi:pilus assembly protein CpaD